MKKLNFILLSIIFLTGQLNAFVLPGPNADPYRFMAEGQSVDDMAKMWQPPSRVPGIVSGRALRATDKDGNICYFTSNGRMALNRSKNGETTFTLGAMSITKDKDGETINVSKHIKGTELVEVQNEFGETLSYKVMGFGGTKVVATLDKDKNLASTYKYTTYGKALNYIVNEMTKGRTVFDTETGLPMYDLDVDGNRMRKYINDKNGRLSEIIDAYGNTTYYDGNGAVMYSADKDGLVLARYNYKYDRDGNYVLESVLDPRTRSMTYFDDKGRQTVTKNHAGAVTTDYCWEGSKLIFTFDRESKETTWYDVDGKMTYTSVDGVVTGRNLYFKGQHVGSWNAKSNQVTVFQNERREVVIQLGNINPNTPVEMTTLVRCKDDKGNTNILTLKDFHQNSNIGIVYSNIEEFEGYILKSDENGNVVEYDLVVEPTAEQIKAWLDAGLINKKYLYIPL